jgi:hypothetical protein
MVQEFGQTALPGGKAHKGDYWDSMASRRTD